MDAKTNGQMAARPVSVRWFDTDTAEYKERLEGGLTKREEFASRILAALVVRPAPAPTGDFGSWMERERVNIFKLAVESADQLLIELAKGGA